MKDGRYVKNLWQSGDIITAHKLNTIEEGIKANELLLKGKAEISHTHDASEIEGLNRIEVDVPTKLSQLENDTNFATEDYVNTKIEEASLGGAEVDLSNYVTKDELSLKADKTYVDSNLSTKATTTYVDSEITKVNNKLNGKTIWCGTKTQYNAITSKNSNTLYFIMEG